VPRYWVGLDQGSGATKACLIDRQGRLRRLVTLPLATHYPSSGWVEHDGNVLARSARTALERLLRNIDPASVGSVGVTAQRSTFIVWEPVTARPLTSAISWQDRRAETFCRTLSHAETMIRRKTGLRLSPHYAAGKIRWLLDHFPDLRWRAEKGKALIGTLDAYLLYRLTRGESWSTDPTHAARTLLMNLRRMEWDPELLELFRIPLRALPPIRPSAFPVGEISIRGARLPVTATLGDQQAALIGLGCRRENEAAINYGTGAFVVLNTGNLPRRVPRLLTSVAWSSPKEVRYLVEGTINAAGSAVDWLSVVAGEKTALIRTLPDLDRLPVVIPSFSGLGAPHWVSGACGAIFDLDLSTNREQLLSAILAGIGCRVREILESMSRHGLRVRRVIAGGGLARLPSLLPLQAGLLGRTILRARVPEGTARGAALLAGHALGHWNLERDPLRLKEPADPVASALPPAAVRRFYRRFRSAASEVMRRGSSR